MMYYPHGQAASEHIVICSSGRRQEVLETPTEEAQEDVNGAV